MFKNNDKILLIIDDTYNEKNGIQTDGVVDFTIIVGRILHLG